MQYNPITHAGEHWHTIDRMHKWQPKRYSFGFVLIRLTSLFSTDKIKKKSSFRTRLVGLISTKTREIFFGWPFMHSVYVVNGNFNVILSTQRLLSLPITSGPSETNACETRFINVWDDLSKDNNINSFFSLQGARILLLHTAIPQVWNCLNPLNLTKVVKNLHWNTEKVSWHWSKVCISKLTILSF